MLNTVTHDLVFPLEMVDAVLFVRKLPTALGAHEGVVLATLVLEMPVEVVIPVVRPLKENKLILINYLRQTEP